MAVVGARACRDPTPATRRPSGLATRRYTARAGLMSRGEESRIAERELASAHLKHHRLTLEFTRMRQP